MATLEQIAEGIKRAHAAGNEADVRKLGAAYRSMQNAPPTSQTNYDSALQELHQKQYPDMPDDEFQRMVTNMPRYQPANMGDLAKSGLTFGLGDEIDSAMGAMGSQLQNWMGNQNAPNFGDAFQTNQKVQDARLALGREQAGILGAVVEGGAGLLTMGPARAGIDAIVQGAPRVAATAPSILRTVLSSGAVGGGLGAIGGAANSTGGLKERAEGALKGAGGGAAIGAAFPLLARGAGAVYDNVAGRFAANDAASRMGIDPEAARFLQTRLAADDSLGPAGMQRMRAAGPEAMLADAGPSARNTLDYAIQSSGGAGRAARDAIDQRVVRSNTRAEQGMDAALGRPQGVYTAEEGLRAGARPQTHEAYEGPNGAYAQSIDYAAAPGRELESLLQSVPPEAIARANRLMRIGRDPASRQIMADIADDGTVTFRTMPDVRQLDYITRALNEEARHGIGAGAMGGQTDMGRAITNLSRDIRQALRQAVPEYATALETAATPIGQREALQFGADILSPALARDEAVATARAMTGPERAFARQGVRSRIDEVVANVKQMASDPNFDARELRKMLTEVSSPAARVKIAALFDNPSDANQLFGTLDEAMRSLELRAGVADNSRTFQRQEMGRQVDAVTNPQGMLATLGKGEPLNAGKRLAQAVTGLTPERSLAAKDAMMRDVVRLLTQQGPGAVQTAGTLSRLGNQRQMASRIADALTNSGALSGPAAYQYGARSGGSRQ